MGKPRYTGDLELIQTRISRSLARWIKNKAKKEGLSVASWLRRTLIKMEYRERTGK